MATSKKLGEWMNKRTPIEVAICLLLIVCTIFLLILIMLYLLFWCMGYSVNCSKHCDEFWRIDPDVVTNKKMRSGRICSKNNIERTVHSFMGSLIELEHLDKYNHFKYVCPVTILSKDYVLTAAECVKPSVHVLKHMFVRVGSNSWSRNGMVHSIKEMKSSEPTNNDAVVLLKMMQPFVTHPSIRAIALPRPIELTSLHVKALSWSGNYFTGYTLREKVAGVEEYKLLLFQNEQCQQEKKGEKILCASEIYPRKYCFYDVGAPIFSGQNLIGVIVGWRCDSFSSNMRFIANLFSYYNFLENTAGVVVETA